MTLFWLSILFLTLLASCFVLWPLWCSAQQKNDPQQDVNKAWYLDRLHDLEIALAQNEIDQATFEQNKIQLQKDFLSTEPCLLSSRAKCGDPSFDFNEASEKLKTWIASLRSQRRWTLPGSPRCNHHDAGNIFLIILAIAFSIASLIIYYDLGASQALAQQNQTLQAQQKADAEVKALGGETAVMMKLKSHLLEHPEEPQGWYLLGRVYFSKNQFHDAAIAFKKAAQYAPNRSDIMTQLAEASYLSPVKNDQQEAQKYLTRALTLAPEDPAALNLSALILYHHGNYEKAIDIWQNLLMQSPADSDTAKALQAAIQKAEAKIKTTSTTPAGKIALPITVNISAALAKEIQANDVLFVYAKALNGPPMPLAIARLPAQLPTQVILDDSMSMTPNLHLHDFSQIVVSARISHSGQAMPQAGDLESAPQKISTRDIPKNISLVIDHQI